MSPTGFNSVSSQSNNNQQNPKLNDFFASSIDNKVTSQETSDKINTKSSIEPINNKRHLWKMNAEPSA